METVKCACGCGGEFQEWNYRGKLRGQKKRFIQGHNRPPRTKRKRPMIIMGDIAMVPLTRGVNAIIDSSDANLLNKWDWCVEWHPDGRKYAARHEFKGGVKRKISMHRMIFGASREDPEIDHKDGNGLNNRRENLRWCTSSQNKANRKSINKSGFRGVYHMKKANRWTAKICVNKKHIHLGCFLTAEDAAKAYNAGAAFHFGEFAVLNQIPDV